jgi:hypothetical protein
MTKPMIRIHNAETDEYVDREMNDEEYSQYLIDTEKTQNMIYQEEEKKQNKNALLERLGITEEEAKLLLS